MGMENPAREGGIGGNLGHLPLVPNLRIQSPISSTEEKPAETWDEHDVRKVEQQERIYEEIEMWSQALESECIRHRAREVTKERIVRLERGCELV